MIDQPASDVLRRARTALGVSPIFELRGVQIELVGESLLISGSVSTFYHKQMAQEAVRAIDKDVELVNTIDVH